MDYYWYIMRYLISGIGNEIYQGDRGINLRFLFIFAEGHFH